MFTSRNTIQSQANSIYGKLDASARSQAVTCSRDLGLLDRLKTGFFSFHPIGRMPFQLTRDGIVRAQVGRGTGVRVPAMPVLGRPQ